MDLSDALKIVQYNLAEKTIESLHFKEQCEERNFNLSKVLECIKNNRILGILEQSEKLYKIWFYYGKHKDLNIIIKILDNKSLRFITLFPCSSKRRKR